jgi:hypothetical protein
LKNFLEVGKIFLYKKPLFYISLAGILASSFLWNCGIKGQLQKNPDFSTADLREAHYIYEDPLMTLAARIRKSDVAGGYQYEFLFMNKGKSPILLNYYGDILTMSYMGKIFSIRKLSKHSEYPKSLDAGQYFVTLYHIDGIFSKSVYEIDRLIFKFKERRYVLERNPGALWHDKDTVL